MKAARIPIFVLASLLAYILCSAAWITAESERWQDAAQQVAEAALCGDTEAAAASLNTLKANWQSHQSYLHIIVSHTELDETGTLLSQAEAAVQQGDMAALYPITAELCSRFHLIAETQQVHLRNIF